MTLRTVRMGPQHDRESSLANRRRARNAGLGGVADRPLGGPTPMRYGRQAVHLSSSVRHVEVFQMMPVETFIFGRRRPLSGQRRADRAHRTSTPSFVMSPLTIEACHRDPPWA